MAKMGAPHVCGCKCSVCLSRERRFRAASAILAQRLALKGPMSERTVYRHEAEEVPPRMEWVPLAKGEVCVHELTLADSLNITERCQRHANDPRGAGVDQSQMVLLQIMMSTYYSEEPEGRRVFADTDFLKIHKLKNWEMDELLKAINRVNEKDAAEQEGLRDFFEASEAEKTSP